MANYEFVVPFDTSDDADLSQASQQYLRSGWDATQSPDDNSVLCHKRFSSPEEGRAELDAMDDGGAARNAFYYQPEEVRPRLNARFQFGSSLPYTNVTNIVDPSTATRNIDQIIRVVDRVAGARADGERPEPNPPDPPPPGRPPADNPGGASIADAEVMLADAQVKIIEMYWGGLDDDVKAKVAEQYFQTQREREKARSGSEAWRAAPDWVLLDTADEGRELYADARLATAILESKYGLLTESNRTDMEEIRVKIAKTGLDTAESLRKSIDQWTTLAKAAPWFMGAALLISVVILSGAFLLVKWNHLNGYQFSLAIFVCALFVVSPATLLLLGRPLRGIDNASLSGKSPGDANSKSGNDTASLETDK